MVQQCGPIGGGVVPWCRALAAMGIGCRWECPIGGVDGLISGGWRMPHRGALCDLDHGLDRGVGFWLFLWFPGWFREVSWWW